MANNLFNSVYNPDVLSCIANLSNDEVFTPPELANKILDMLPQELFENPDTTFLDPCCKSGVFLREIAKRLIKGLERQMPDLDKRLEHIFSKQIFGIAITELTSLLSRRSVYCSKFPSSQWSAYQFPEEKPQGNIIYKKIKHTWKDGKCVHCGASRSEYDRDEQLESHAYQFIHNFDVKRVFNMKFDVIIGNPPYQLSDGGNGASAKPIYHLFIEKAKLLNPRFLTMIIPARWYAGGKGLDDFRNTMLSDKRIRVIKDYVNAKECFPNNSIGGGVCYFLWEKEYNGPCDFTTILNGKESQQMRNLDEFPIFVRHNSAIRIIHKVKSINENALSDIMLARNPFGIASYERGEESPIKNGYSIHSSKGIGYTTKESILQNNEYADAYKVMISKVTYEHAGEPDKDGMMRVLSTIRVLKPKEVCTDSYLIIGKFSKETGAKNLQSFLKTKFSRFLLLQAVSSINLSKDKFCFVPLQDFSSDSDINWKASTENIDKQLYTKYALNEEEIAFIESMIRPME